VRALLPRLALLLGGLVAGLAAAEVAARLRSPAGHEDLVYNSLHLLPGGMFKQHPVLGQVPTPGWSGTLRTLEYAADVRFNQRGLRGPPLRAKAPGAYRILAVGDSFTLGRQVGEAESWPALLAAEVSARAGREVEVLNAGMDGFATEPSTTRLTRLAAPLAVDAALLTVFVGNDFFEDCARFPGRSPEVEAARRAPPPGRPAAGGQRQKPRVWRAPPWLAWSHLAAEVQVALASRRLAADPGTRVRARHRAELSIFAAAGRALRGMMGCTVDLLGALAARCEQLGIPCFVAAAPAAFQVHPRRLAPTFALVDLDATAVDLEAPTARLIEALPPGLAGLNLLPPLRDAAGEPLYYRYDAHWNPEGHAAVAQALAGWLTSPAGPPGLRAAR